MRDTRLVLDMGARLWAGCDGAHRQARESVLDFAQSYLDERLRPEYETRVYSITFRADVWTIFTVTSA